MAHCFSSYDLEALQDEAIFEDNPLQRFGKFLWSIVAFLFGWIPFLSNLFRQKRPGLEEVNPEAESMKYALLGLDIIVDEDLKPWCLELNRSPTLNPEPRDATGSKVKAEVVE